MSLTLLDRKDCTNHVLWSKSTFTTGVWAGQGLIHSIEKWIHFFLSPWLFVCQFIEISNQKKPTLISMFETSPIGPFWLEISIIWHTKIQGQNENISIFLGWVSTPAPPILPVDRVVLLHKTRFVKRRLGTNLFPVTEKLFNFRPLTFLELLLLIWIFFNIKGFRKSIIRSKSDFSFRKMVIWTGFQRQKLTTFAWCPHEWSNTNPHLRTQ